MEEVLHCIERRLTMQRAFKNEKPLKFSHLSNGLYSRTTIIDLHWLLVLAFTQTCTLSQTEAGDSPIYLEWPFIPRGETKLRWRSGAMYHHVGLAMSCMILIPILKKRKKKDHFTESFLQRDWHHSPHSYLEWRGKIALFAFFSLKLYCNRVPIFLSYYSLQDHPFVLSTSISFDLLWSIHLNF